MAFLKTTVDAIQYDIDWSGSMDEGDSILTSAWSVPSGISLGADSHTTTVASAFIYGGTDGEFYECTNTIITVGGETIARTIVIQVVLEIIIN